MNEEKLPRFVPITEVGEYTDRITINNLGLPVGFDDESLQLNLRGLSRTMRAGGMARVIISAFDGEKTEEVFGISGINGDGAATATKLRVARRANLADSKAESDLFDAPLEYRWTDAQVRLNANEIDSRIVADGDKWKRRQFDPRAQAKYLNQGMRSGLSKAAVESLVPNPKYDLGIMLSGMAFNDLFNTIFGHGTPLYNITWATVGYLPANGVLHMMDKRRNRELPGRKWSNMYHVPLDRLVAAKALARTTTFIRANRP